MKDTKKKEVEEPGVVTGIIIGTLLGIIVTLIGVASQINGKPSQPCDEKHLLKIIYQQDSVIQKYTTYRNWFREVHGIETNKLEQFKHK